MHRDAIEPIVGALVLAIAAVFAWFAYTSTGLGGRQGYELAAQFSRVGSLGTGSDVRVSGVKVGTVTALTLDPNTYLADVHFSVARAVQIPDDSVAVITSEGLLGSQFLSISPGGSDKMLRPGERVAHTQAPVDLMELLGKYIFSPPTDQSSGQASGGAKTP